MNNRHFHIALILTALLLAPGVLAACAPSALPTPFGANAVPNNTPAQAPTSAVASAPTSAPTNAPASAPTNAPANAPTMAPATSVTLAVAQNATLGSFLADSQGRTLYLFMKDTKNTSNCYNGCATTWPPLVSANTPAFGDGIKADLVGTTQRKDGSTQITYNGWPLYYYAPDKAPGDTKGQGVGGVWFVITPTGDAFTGGAAPAAPAQAPTQAPANPYGSGS